MERKNQKNELYCEAPQERLFGLLFIHEYMVTNDSLDCSSVDLYT